MWNASWRDVGVDRAAIERFQSVVGFTGGESPRCGRPGGRIPGSGFPPGDLEFELLVDRINQSQVNAWWSKSENAADITLRRFGMKQCSRGK